MNEWMYEGWATIRPLHHDHQWSIVLESAIRCAFCQWSFQQLAEASEFTGFLSRTNHPFIGLEFPICQTNMCGQTEIPMPFDVAISNVNFPSTCQLNSSWLPHSPSC
jgi:hypothetical protein